MLNAPRTDDAQRLAGVRAPWCVTIYGDAGAWLRGDRATDVAEGQIRSALDALAGAGAPASVIAATRQQLEQVSARVSTSPGQLGRLARSVGIFASEHSAEIFLLSRAPAPWVGLADRFLIGPLLEEALTLIPPVFVLALSENEVRLVDVTTRPPELLEVPGLPRNLKSTIDLDLTGDRDTLAHLRISEDPKGRLREYARAIDRSIGLLLGYAGAVVVIAAAEPLASIYRSTTSYLKVASSTIVGNHDGESIAVLADLAAPIIERYRREVFEAHLARFAELPARDLAVADLPTVAAAARDGAVDTLFVDMGRRIPGVERDGDNQTVIDQVDEIVRDALSTDATIVPVQASDLPTSEPVAAVLRYARTGAPVSYAD